MFHATNGLFVLAVFFAVYGVVWSFLQKITQVPDYAAVGVIFVVGCLFVGTVVLWNRFGPGLCHFATALSDRTFVLAVLVAGITLRLCWATVADVHLVSDAYSYFVHAQQMLLEGYYGFPKGGPDAHWPPGYPLVLYIFLGIFGISKKIIILVNILLFAATTIGVFVTAKTVYGPTAARLAILVVVLWPNLLFVSASGSKEAIICAILPWLLLLFIHSTRRLDLAAVAVMGLLLGFSALTQPSFLLIFGVIVLAYALVTKRLRQTSVFTLVLLATMAATIAPWSARNHAIYHKLVMISTNGGDVFYRANNPNARPGYNATRPDSPLANLPALERNRLGYQLGMAWIRDNPVDFLRLAVQKSILYLGNDDTCLWETFDDPSNPKKSPIYKLLVATSNGYWIIVLLLVFVATWNRRKLEDEYLLLFMGIFLCMLLIDAVFEAGQRHHIPLYGLMAIAIGSLCSRRVERRATGRRDEVASSRSEWRKSRFNT